MTSSYLVEQNECIDSAYTIAPNTSVAETDNHIDFQSDVGSVRLSHHPGDRHSLNFMLGNGIELEVRFAYASDLRHALRWLAGNELLPVMQTDEQ